MKPLSQRLETIATLVPVGARVCDIGCDHGYLAIYLRLNNIAKTVIAADLNELPLLMHMDAILTEKADAEIPWNKFTYAE